MNRLATVIRKRRKELGQTQAQLAEGIISVPYLSLIENGKATPGKDILTLLANRLQISVHQLLGITDQQKVEAFDQQLQTILLDIFQTRFSTARQKIAECKKNAEPLGDLHTMMEIDLLEIHSYLHCWDTVSKGFQLLKEFERQWGQSLETSTLKMKYFHVKGLAAMKAFQFQSAFRYLKEAKQHWSADNSEIEKAYIDLALGFVSFFTPQFSVGFTSIEKACQILQQNDQPYGIILCYLCLSTGYRYLGDIEQAKFYIRKALRLESQFHFPTLFSCYAHLELSACYISQNKIEEGQEHLEIAKGFVTKNQRFEQGMVDKLSGLIAFKHEQYETASDFISQARTTLKNHLPIFADCSVYLGKIAFVQQDFARFRIEYQQALRAYEASEMFSYAASVAHILGKFYQQQGDTQKTIEYFALSSQFYQESFPNLHFILPSE